MQKNVIAMAIMSAIIGLNSALGLGLLTAGSSALLTVINSQNIFVLAGLEMILLLFAYVAAKHEPLPTPS